MKKLSVQFSVIAALATLTILPTLASANATFEGMAREYRHAYKSNFHDANEVSCVEAYENGEINETKFEFKKTGFVLTATELGRNHAVYSFMPNMWQTGYVAHGEKNGTHFELHMRETLMGNLIFKMTVAQFGVLQHPIGYINCTINK